MTNNSDVSRRVASGLLEIQAVKLSVDPPFIWASGLKSPIYCDNRQILSYPVFRQEVAGFMSQLVKEQFPDAEVIAGVATGAIAIGILVAGILDLPFVYVRSASKGHGLGNQVEGRLMPGKKTVVVEDLVSTGKSSLAAFHALAEAGFDVKGMTAIFTYQLPLAQKMMQQSNCRLFTLSNYTALIEQALENNVISESELQTLKQWREDPQAWSDQRV